MDRSEVSLLLSRLAGHNRHGYKAEAAAMLGITRSHIGRVLREPNEVFLLRLKAAVEKAEAERRAASEHYRAEAEAEARRMRDEAAGFAPGDRERLEARAASLEAMGENLEGDARQAFEAGVELGRARARLAL